MFSEDDARLVEVLQVAPRASWTAVGGVLGVSAVTAAKRWQRLVDEGLAWVTAGPGMSSSNPQCLAYVEISCHPQMRIAVGEAVARHGPAVTVELTTGNADLLVTVAAVDLPTMSHYVLEHLPDVEGVLSTKVRIATRLYGEGSSWRLRVLPEPELQAAMALRSEQTGPPRTAEEADVASDTSKAILSQLVLDGRISYADLAERTGISPTTARRRVMDLLQSGVVMLRTDVSAADAGWPVENYLLADVPAAKLGQTARALSQLPQARLTSTLAASESLMFASWLPTVGEVHRLELSIAARIPDLRVIDRIIVLRVLKRNGRLIDGSGRATGTVPINIWDDLLCDDHGSTDAGAA